jgi:hypothetical protein
LGQLALIDLYYLYYQLDLFGLLALLRLYFLLDLLGLWRL